MLIAIADEYPISGPDLFAGHQSVPFKMRSDREAALDLFRQAEVIALRGGGFAFTRELIEDLPRLQFVQKSGTGVDAFDLAALTDHGILLSNNAGLNASCVADHTILLALLCLRNNFRHLASLRKGVWNRSEPGPTALQLEGKTVGIVGMGDIGTHAARRFLGFGANVLAHGRRHNGAATILAGVRWVSMDDLLRESDVVSLHVPLTHQTRRLIGGRELGLMKRTAVLVNTSRGPVVDEEALYQALVDGRIRAAGLDVFEKEPTPSDNPLLALENVYATPHCAGLSEEMEQMQAEASLSNVERFLSGGAPLRLLNPEVLKSAALRAKSLQ